MFRDDASLVAACRRGDPAAWNSLVDRYGRLVYSIPRRYGMAEADCDDVFQGVFTILYQKLDTLADHSKLSSWLITTTHRECWRLGRRSTRTAATDIDQVISDVAAPPAEEAARWEQQHLVHLALQMLGGSCERLLRALFLELGTGAYEVIAKRLGIKVGSIGPTRARCFRKLEPILARLGVTAPAEDEAEDTLPDPPHTGSSAK